MKKCRQQAILELINNNVIDTQESLKEYLQKEGISVTQATLSRDIRELKLKKDYDNNNKYRYIQLNSKLPDFPQMFIDTVISIDYGMNMVVLKCHVGMANAACAIMDKMHYSDILGTIAGDDTVFILMKSEEKAKWFSDSMKKLILKVR